MSLTGETQPTRSSCSCIRDFSDAQMWDKKKVEAAAGEIDSGWDEASPRWTGQFKQCIIKNEHHPWLLPSCTMDYSAQSHSNVIFFFLPLKSHTDGFAASWREHTLWCMSTCHSHTDKRSCNSAGNFHFIPDVRGPAASLRLTCDSSTLTFLMRNHRRVVAPVYSKHQMLFLTFCSSWTGAVMDFPQF